MFNRIKKNFIFLAVHKKLAKVYAMMFALACTHGHVFAQSVGMSGFGDTMEVQWPWIKFLNSLATQLTGPLPMTLGVLGLAGAAIALFQGHAGGGTQKFIIIILVVSTCLFAPTFITYISTSAGGLTIMGVTP